MKFKRIPGLKDCRKPKFWADVDLEGRVGIECDHKELTFDGHYVCLVECDPDVRGALARAQILVDFLNRGATVLSPKKP